MPFIKVYIHFVWSTKNRYPFLNNKELRQNVWQHIFDNARSKGIFIDYISGHNDHCHCLVSLGSDQTIQKTMNLIKGESSFWINKNKLTTETFEWQNDYYAASVSGSMIKKTRLYIKNQEEHHKTKTSQDEYDEFISKYDFMKINDSV
ncbi:MAG: IS200/IS605 family transposase [Bacteroidota bacterium]